MMSDIPYYKRMIRCPGHWLVNPKVDVYLREPVPELKDCSEFVEIEGRRFNLRKMRIKKDRWGRKIVDWKKLHALRKTGQVLHPLVSAAWAIEHVYDPVSFFCQVQCKRGAGQPCKEGQGRVLDRTIKRLN